MVWDLTGLIAALTAAFAAFSFFVSIYAWLKRREVFIWHKKTARLEKKLIDTPPELVIEQNKTKISEAKERISAGEEVLKRLKQDIKALVPTVDMIQSGLYPPTFSYLDTEDLRESVRAERVEQLNLIKKDVAVIKYGSFTHFGSKKDGAALVADYKKVFLRTFNAEFEHIRKKQRMSNLDASRDKLHRVSEQLESLGTVLSVEIGPEYLTAKARELDVWAGDIKERHEAKEQRKKQQRLLREQNKEFKKDDEDIEAEIEVSKAMLNKAKKRAIDLVGMTDKDVADELKSLKKEISEHEAKIEESMSEAQKTKVGYIYVISNVGSFGKGVLKIGMTRRLEPMDRVVELGDASVPYRFDVHTIAFVENAPDVERALHRHFDEYRVNEENERKEFFEVSVDDVRRAMESLEVNSEWYYDVEAREYSESEGVRSARRRSEEKQIETVYPEAI